MKYPPAAKKLRLFVLLIVVLCHGIAETARSDDGQPSTAKNYKPVVGEPHFDFCLPEIRTAKPVRLSDFRGKKIILMHFASW